MNHFVAWHFARSFAGVTEITIAAISDPYAGRTLDHSRYCHPHHRLIKCTLFALAPSILTQAQLCYP